MSRQPHWDATVGNRRQSPAPYHRIHRDASRPAHIPGDSNGAQWRRHWEALGGCLLGKRLRRTARALPAAKRATSTARRASPVEDRGKVCLELNPAGCHWNHRSRWQDQMSIIWIQNPGPGIQVYPVWTLGCLACSWSACPIAWSQIRCPLPTVPSTP